MTSNIATAEPTQQTDPLIINSRVSLAILEIDEETTVWIRSYRPLAWTQKRGGGERKRGNDDAKTDGKMLLPEEGTEKTPAAAVVDQRLEPRRSSDRCATACTSCVCA